MHFKKKKNEKCTFRALSEITTVKLKSEFFLNAVLF